MFFFQSRKKGFLQPRCPPAIGDVTEFLLGTVGNGELSVGSFWLNYLENIEYHFFKQPWLVLGVKLMEINSNLFSRYCCN